MQKQLKPVKKVFVDYPADFPLSCFMYMQPYKTYNDMHEHSCAELGICLEGSGLFFIANKIYTFKKGEISFVMPGCPHIAQSADHNPSKWYFISFEPDFFDIELKKDGSIIFRDGDVFNIIKLLAGELLNESVDKTICSLLLKTCMHFILRSADSIPAIDSRKDFSTVLPALQYILQNYAEHIDTKILAEVCHLSVGHFREVFKQSIGNSPIAYLAQVRMLAAADMLRETDRPVAQIASDAGYTTLSSFNREFQKTYSVSPLKFRKLNF